MASTGMFPIMGVADMTDARISREQLSHWIEMAIALLDTMDGDPDIEPSLGAPETFVALPFWPGFARSSEGSQAHWADGGNAFGPDEPPR